MLYIPPAQLWVGARAVVIDYVHAYLRTLWCQDHDCGTCVTCNQVNEHRFYALRWFTPKGSTYLVEQLDEVLQVTRFSLAHGENFFFVFEIAEALSSVSASRLLKIMEEPPRGYHFILVTELEGAVMPTLISRCVVRTCTALQKSTVQALLTFLLDTHHTRMNDFGKELDRLLITEAETRALLSDLIDFWRVKLQKSIAQENVYERERAEAKLAFLVHVLSKLPMPGSWKLFWRMIFLNIMYQ